MDANLDVLGSSKIGLLESSIAEMSSHIKGRGLFHSGTISSSKRRSHTLSLVASLRATYSASMVDNETHCCLRLLQAIGHPFKRKTKPDFELRFSKFPAKSASEYPIGVATDGPFRSPKCFLSCRYDKIFLAVFQCCCFGLSQNCEI